MELSVERPVELDQVTSAVFGAERSPI